MSRPPTFIAAVAATLPSLHTAILELPPPTSQFMIVFPVVPDLATAPEPYAARTLSKLGPAVAATNLPVSPASSFTIHSAFSFFAVSPVIMTAPVSISETAIPASR